MFRFTQRVLPPPRLNITIAGLDELEGLKQRLPSKTPPAAGVKDL